MILIYSVQFSVRVFTPHGRFQETTISLIPLALTLSSSRIPSKRCPGGMRGAAMLVAAASVSALRMGGLARVRSPCMVIEPEIYREPGVRPTLA